VHDSEINLEICDSAIIRENFAHEIRVEGWFTFFKEEVIDKTKSNVALSDTLNFELKSWNVQPTSPKRITLTSPGF